jgi:hypothetical protein
MWGKDAPFAANAAEVFVALKGLPDLCAEQACCACVDVH